MASPKARASFRNHYWIAYFLLKEKHGRHGPLPVQTQSEDSPFFIGNSFGLCDLLLRLDQAICGAIFEQTVSNFTAAWRLRRNALALASEHAAPPGKDVDPLVIARWKSLIAARQVMEVIAKLPESDSTVLVKQLIGGSAITVAAVQEALIAAKMYIPALELAAIASAAKASAALHYSGLVYSENRQTPWAKQWDSWKSKPCHEIARRMAEQGSESAASLTAATAWDWMQEDAVPPSGDQPLRELEQVFTGAVTTEALRLITPSDRVRMAVEAGKAVSLNVGSCTSVSSILSVPFSLLLLVLVSSALPQYLARSNHHQLPLFLEQELLGDPAESPDWIAPHLWSRKHEAAR